LKMRNGETQKEKSSQKISKSKKTLKS
jgi:hypothetical protein